jgi:hypothetical protein
LLIESFATLPLRGGVKDDQYGPHCPYRT